MKLLAGFLTILIAITIAIATLSPVALPSVGGSDKLHHFLAFAGLCLPFALLHRAVFFRLAPWAIAFGGAIELIQPYVNRTADWLDFAADISGVATVTAAVILWEKFAKKGNDMAHRR